MGERKVRISFVFSMVGAMIAYYIGAATGTGQEFFQVYSAHGVMGILGTVLQHVALALLGLVVILTCQKKSLNSAKDCFIYFLGKPVGMVIYYYTVAYVFCTLVQLISGTGSLVQQYYGIPYYVGSIVLAVLLVLSVIFGFKAVIAIISKIAPIIIVVMAIVCAIGLIAPTDGLAVGSEIARSSSEIMRTSSSWLGSTILHHTYLILFLVPYYQSCYTLDPKATKQETILWIVIAYTLLAILVILMVASHIANISIVIGTAAPNLAIAMKHAPKLATLLVVMTVAASFTTTAPIALIAAEYFAKPGTQRFKVAGILVVLAGLAVSFLGSYAAIINVLVSVSGRVGIGVYAVAIIYKIYKCVADSKADTAQ